MSDLDTVKNETLATEDKKNLARKRAFITIIIFDCLLALVLAWAIISIFVK